MMQPGEAATAPAEGQTLGGRGRWVDYANLVKLPHTVFALPFALVGVVIASYEAAVLWSDLVWVVLAFTAARFAAMGFNRIVDRRIDAVNPRTSGRELPSGRMTVTQAAAAVGVASTIFLGAAAMLNPLCLYLSPFALGWVFFYSFTKQFTRWSHLVLGFALAIAPVGGYIAITGSWSDPAWLLIALAAAVTFWVAGFDVIYSLQDEAFDRAHRLRSIPAALGRTRAIAASRGLHALCVGCFIAVGFLSPALGALYWVAVGLIGAMLAYEHRLVRPDDLSRVDAAFFTVNGVISIVFFALVLTERLVW